MGQVKESKRGRYYWFTGKYRRRFFRLLYNMALGALAGFILVFTFEEIIFGDIIHQGIDFPSKLPALFYGIIDSIRQNVIYQVLFVYGVCSGGIYGLVSIKAPKVTEQLKAVGQNVKETVTEMAEGVKELPGSMVRGVASSALFGPAGAMAGVAGTLPAVGKIATAHMKFLGRGFKNAYVRLPYWLILCAPFFLVYFFIMIIPELIVGTFSDEVVETLDKTVIVISILGWIVGIVWCVWHFLL